MGAGSGDEGQQIVERLIDHLAGRVAAETVGRGGLDVVRDPVLDLGDRRSAHDADSTYSGVHAGWPQDSVRPERT